MSMVICKCHGTPRDTDTRDMGCCCCCGEWFCLENVVFTELGDCLCHECGRDEAERQCKADAPGVWPEWAKDIEPRPKETVSIKVVSG